MILKGLAHDFELDPFLTLLDKLKILCYNNYRSQLRRDLYK